MKPDYSIAVLQNYEVRRLEYVTFMTNTEKQTLSKLKSQTND